MNILICDKISQSAINKLKEADFSVDIKDDITHDELKLCALEYDCLVVRSRTKITRDILHSGHSSGNGKLKLIVRGGVGLDNIDIEAAKELGIEVKNTPKSSARSVVELVLGFMIMLSRNLYGANKSLKGLKWEKSNGNLLLNKTLGIIGFGNIGRSLSGLSNALGMRVIAFDEVQINCNDVVSVSFEQLLKDSDFITLHCPKNECTTKLIGEKELALMKESAFLINTARGGIIDETALLKALKNKKIAGAALDVFEIEPPINTELLSLENVLATPHIGASTKEAQDGIGQEIYEVISEFAKSIK
ncbi:MAG: D-2-hydroxyacid dehydrogenase [Helicobacter sp.]|nr:D-2-hydroxyacid dehydrogenase [Helicobacter sp.]